MAIKETVQLKNLDKGLVLSPDRYNPERKTDRYGGKELSDFVTFSNERLTKSQLNSGDEYVVFSTSDAKEGLLAANNSVVGMNEVGSTKKIIKPGDVIISRLRPRLRQVAYVDKGLKEIYGRDTILLCSTEYFVLRSTGDESISFLAPTLLSEEIQRVLSVSTEGGSRPRFKKKTLLNLPIPDPISKKRNQMSKRVVSSALSVRKSNQAIQSMIEECTRAF